MTPETRFCEFLDVKFYLWILCRMTVALFIRILMPYNKGKDHG